MSSVIIPSMAFKNLSFEHKRLEVFNVKRMINCFEGKITALVKNDLKVRTDIEKIIEEGTKR